MANNLSLSERMKMICGLVDEGARIADVGCDHGYVSIELVKTKCVSSVAMDVRRGPLESARKNVSANNLLDRIRLVLSDGLKNYHIGEADTLIIAGMGGPLMWKILSDEPKKTNSFSKLVLQPQSEIPQFRHALNKSGFHIVKEEALWEDGKFYVAIVATPPKNNPNYSEFDVPDSECSVEETFGGNLLEKKDAGLKTYLEKQIGDYEKLIFTLKGNSSDKAALRICEVEKALMKLKKAYELYR